ncbi:MAG TPA: PilZ domain-containing protein [Candidatus Acidoferrales bacterium]|nr:PilZ domain-containing protein [Candidatus Acidoferrales bacterium]
MTEPAQEPSGAERRRSERVFLQVGIFVQGVSNDGHAFREKTKTLSVNAHGALIHLAQDVRPGETVTLTHSLTLQQESCRVVYAKSMSGNTRAVGLEFLNPAPKFWQIAFPPTDWKPYEK